MSIPESLRQALLHAGVDEECVERVEVAAQQLDREKLSISKGIPAKFFPAISAVLTKMLQSAGATYNHPDFEAYFESDYFSAPTSSSAAEQLATSNLGEEFREEGEANNG